MAFLQIQHAGHDVVTHDVEVVRTTPDETCIRLPPGPLTFGRTGPREPGAPHVEVRAANVSRRQCAITPHEDGFHLSDLESAGGTFMENGERLSRTPHLLLDGEMFFVGSTTARLRLELTPR